MTDFKDFLSVALNFPEKFNHDLGPLKYIIHYNRIFSASLTEEEGVPIYNELVGKLGWILCARDPCFEDIKKRVFNQMEVQKEESLKVLAQAQREGIFSLCKTTQEDQDKFDSFDRENRKCPTCGKKSAQMSEPYMCLDHFLLKECQQ
jgi:hypothetical protein